MTPFGATNIPHTKEQNSMKTVTYTIPNISCDHCVHTIKMELSDLEGVKTVEATKDPRQATITFTDPATETQIKSLLEEINYPVS
jgi:copper chaperone CopZ